MHAKLAIYAKNCKNRVSLCYSNTQKLKRFLILRACSSYRVIEFSTDKSRAKGSPSVVTIDMSNRVFSD